MLEQVRKILFWYEGKRHIIASTKIAIKIGIVEYGTNARIRAFIFECAKQYNLPPSADNIEYYFRIYGKS